MMPNGYYRKPTWRIATNSVPELINNKETTFKALITEYLFVCIYKGCAESLASENASRLEAMLRAEKNIEEF